MKKANSPPNYRNSFAVGPHPYILTIVKITKNFKIPLLFYGPSTWKTVLWSPKIICVHPKMERYWVLAYALLEIERMKEKSENIHNSTGSKICVVEIRWVAAWHKAWCSVTRMNIFTVSKYCENWARSMCGINHLINQSTKSGDGCKNDEMKWNYTSWCLICMT